MPIYRVDGKIKDGLQKYKIRINYVGADGKKRQLTRVAFGKEAAREIERTLGLSVKTPDEKPIAKPTVKKLYDEFIASRKYEIRESSLEKHEVNYRLHISPKLAGIRIDKLTVPKLQEWKIYMEQKGFALKTKTNAFGTLRAMLNYAVKMEYIGKNPINAVGNFKEALAYKQEMKIYTIEEFQRFIGAAEKSARGWEAEHHSYSEWGYYVFFSIAFYTGLRKGEIHALKWSDLDGAYLNVRRSITQRLKGDDRETPPKNKPSIRTLQMPLPLIDVLDEHRRRQEILGNFNEDYRICGGERCLRDTTIQKKQKYYTEQAGLHHIRIHDFRHSHVSVLANEGINIQEIARRLGHSRVEMTWNTYSHMYPREEEKAVDVFNKISKSVHARACSPMCENADAPVHALYTLSEKTTKNNANVINMKMNANPCKSKVSDKKTKVG